MASSVASDGVRERGIPMENLLLIIVLVPVAVFVVLLVLIIVFVLAGLWWCKHRSASSCLALFGRHFVSVLWL